METIYQTIVKDCGCDVGAFDKKNFLITFGHKTLVTLKDFSNHYFFYCHLNGVLQNL